MVRKIFTSRISNGCNSFDTMCLCVCVRVFQKRNFFSYQSAKLTNCPPVPRKHSPQITTKSDLVLICKDSLVGSGEQLVNLALWSSKKLRFWNTLVCVATLTAERTDIQIWLFVCRSSGRISRSSSKIKGIGQMSRSWGKKCFTLHPNEMSLKIIDGPAKEVTEEYNCTATTRGVFKTYVFFSKIKGCVIDIV